MKQFYEWTKHPDIFKNVYWGKTQVDDASPEEIQLCINRNKFVEDFRIRKVSDAHMPSCMHFSWDHPEIYLSHDMENAYVLVVSPYGSLADHKSILVDTLEMVSFLKLYHSNASTFIKTFGSLKEYEQFQNKLNEL